MMERMIRSLGDVVDSWEGCDAVKAPVWLENVTGNIACCTGEIVQVMFPIIASYKRAPRRYKR